MRKIILFLVLTFNCVLFATAQNVSQAESNLALQLVDANKNAIGISDDLLSHVKVIFTSEDATTGIRYVSLQQTYKGIPVHNQIKALSFRNGKVLSNFGTLDPSIEKTINVASGIPAISAESAVQSALADRGFHATQMAIATKRSDEGRMIEFGKMGISSENITAQLSWIPIEATKSYALAWKVYIVPKTTSDYWMVRVNAVDNSILGMDNYTDYDNWGTPNTGANVRYPGFEYGISSANTSDTKDNFLEFKKINDPDIVTTAQYRVVPLPAESPLHPGGAPALRTDPWTNPGVVANAVTLKWHTGAASTDYDYTRGNNVWAYEDRTAPANTGTVAKSASSTTAFPNLTFNFVPDFTLEPTVTNPPNQQFNITNLFYWNNLIHDILYGYGFTEANKNFQDDNLGRGGLGGDWVRAEAQDASGTNNANFSTPADGSLPRMQMYLWTAPTPDRDGDVDNGIIIHEYGHGVSNRLNPGGTGCLGNSEQAGEGWSDYFGLMLTQNWATAVPGDGFNSPRGIGTYALNQPNNGPGIRPARYCTDFAVNNYTYANIGSMAVPHGVGFVFCTALWEMTWELINDPSTTGIDPNIYNFAGTGGNVVALRLVMEGLRTQQCQPGFISARNAIMKADTTLYGASHACAILRAFARRGMGLGASEGSTTNNNDQVVSFNGGGPSMVFTQNGAAGVPELQNIVYNHAITANCSAIANHTLRDTLPVNVNFVSATNGGTYTPATRVVSWPVNIPVTTTQNYGLTVQVAAGSYFPPVTLINESVPSTTISGFWTTSSTPAGNPWIAHNVRSKSAPNSFFTVNLPTVSQQTIETTNSFAIGATAPVLSFWHWYNSESSWDGGVLEISTNGGSTWSDIGNANFTQNGYNGTLNNSPNPLTGRQAWNGNSGAFVQTKVNMTPYANQANVKLRWRFGSDDLIGATGWNLDDILMETRAVVNLRSNLFNAANVRVSFNDTVTVILPGTTASPNVTINQAAAQADPTGATPILFTAVFDQPVTGFATGDVTLSGTAGANSAVVTGGPTTYTITVSGMTGSGTVIASIPAGVCVNATNDPNTASTSTDNSVTYNAPPGCTSVDPVANQTVCNGASTAAVNFTSPIPGTTFSWVNNTTSIGLGASGTGNIPSFTATNASAAPVTATITVTPTINIVTPTTSVFNYTGAAQTFTVPAGVTSMVITTLGAQGGSGSTGLSGGGPTPGGAGGKGARATGSLAVTPGQVLNIFVGGAGNSSGVGGFNGGGNGGSANAGGGGGASDVRFPGTASTDRIIVAAGGGGGGRGGCESSFAIFGGDGGGGGLDGAKGADAPTSGGLAGGGFGAVTFNGGAAGIGCAGFLGAPGLISTATTGGAGGAGQSCCCFSFASIPGGGGGGGGFPGGGGGGGGSAGTTGCSGNDKGAGGGGAGGTSSVLGVTSGVVTNDFQTGNGQVILFYNVTTICNGPSTSFTITVNPTATVNTVPNQTVCAGAPTAPVNFTSPSAGAVFNWTNNTPAIGLAASGTGNIPSFTALNPGATPLVATITVTPGIPIGAGIPGGPVTFSNTANIAIPASGTGSGAGSASNPYPSNITVSGLPTTGVSVESIRLTNIQHTWSDDIGVLLVSPSGQKFVPMARVGGSGGFDATATVTLKDGSPAMPTGTAAIASGTYAPTAGATAIWPAPAPGAPYSYPAPNGSATFANTFNTSSNYNGTWSLYVTDMAAGDVGNIAGGWAITLVTPTSPAPVCAGTPSSFTITVNPNPTIVITADPGTTICEGDPTLLTVVTGTLSGPGVLYTQGPAGPVNGSPSQVFEPANTAFNSQSADDFVVPSGATWSITQMTANGIGSGNPTSVNLFFYSNSGSNLPGALLASYPNLTTFTRVGGNYTVTLPTALSLTGGTYWVSLQVNMPFASGGQWFWGNYGAPVVGSPYAWQNPGGGFATPCTTWGYGGTGCNVGGGAANVNNIFSLTGTSMVGGAPLPAGYTFLWSPAAGLSSTTSNPVAASPMNTTTYTVTATTAGGCTRTGSILITVNKRPTVTTQPISRANCEGTSATFTVAGTGTGLTYQWQVSTAGCAGPWVNVPAAAPYSGGTTATLTVNPVTLAMSGYAYRCVLGGACAPINNANISGCAVLTVNPNPPVTVSPAISCGGVAGISGTLLTASGANNYTWSPVGGLYTNPTATVPYVAGGNTATIYAAPTAFTVYTVTGSFSATGCFSTATAFVNYTPPPPTVTPSSVTMCLGDPAVRLISSSSTTSSAQFCSGPISVVVPDNNPAGAISNITVSGIPASCNVSAMSVTFNMTHTWDGDIALALKAPNGNILNLNYYLSNTGGNGPTTGFVNTKISSTGTASLSSGTNPYTGTFRADAVIGTTPPSGPIGYLANVSNWNALYSVPNGTWTLAMVDGFGGDQGTLTSWCIDMSYICGVPSTPAVWSPIAGLFNDAAATIPYTGTPRDTVWTRPTPAGVYPYQVNVQSLPAAPLPFTNPGLITMSATTASPANPSPANLVVSGLPTSGVSVKSVSINGFSHTWAGDVNIVLQSPSGQNVILMANSNADPQLVVNNINLIFDDAATASIPATAPLPGGVYKPTNRNGSPFAFLAPGPTVTGPVFPASPTLSTFTGNMNGTWKLFVEDRVPFDGGSISGGFTVNFDLGLAACTSPARTVVVTVNQPVALNNALPANQTICTDKVATFNVAITSGTGPFTYQWQVSSNNGNTFTNIANGGVYSGATTATLTITAPAVGLSGNLYRCIVGGAAPCAAATSFNARLTVNPLPTVVISAAPYTSLHPGLTTTLSSTVSPSAAATYSWLRNGVALTNPSLGVVSGLGTGSVVLDVDGMGDYQLRVTDINGCTNTSNTITIKDSASGNCFIYPNPTSGQFQVRYYSVANNVLPRGIVIYDAKGDRVKVQNYIIGRPYDRMDVDMRAYGKGLYWVEIVDRNGNRLSVCRVVIQ